MSLVIFLRGVNVGGHKTFRPTLLVEQLGGYGLVNIGAAGTLVARRPGRKAQFSADLRRCLPFDTEVMICTGQEFMKAASQHPFGDHLPTADIVRFLSILGTRPRLLPSVPLQLPDAGPCLLQILQVQGRFVFGTYRREMKAIGFLGKLDSLFGTPATTRNWNTIGQVLNVLQND
ncbi:MAG: DUF1697 domain-containing protein [Acidobacteria bacterium]|nr:DUF1697 domain-containing protein [Acidobacteriota bacterium]